MVIISGVPIFRFFTVFPFVKPKAGVKHGGEPIHPKKPERSELLKNDEA